MYSYSELGYLIANIVAANIKLLEDDGVRPDVKKLALEANKELARMILSSGAGVTTKEE